jgi:hypothetical protein
VSIHRNAPGRLERTGRTYRLEMPQGVSVFPDGSADAPCLPLLGLRTIIANKLRLVIDGTRRDVTLSRGGWFT